MTEVDERSRYASVTVGARVFALIVLAAPVALTGDYGPILTVILLAAVWLIAVFVEGLERVPVMPALVVEASLVAFLAAITLTDSAVLLPAIVIPLFVAGLVRGSRGMLEVLGANVIVFLATLLAAPTPALSADVSRAFTWLMVGVGVGAFAALVHNIRAEQPTSTASSYRDARALITQLLDLSGELVDGLDPVSIGQNVVDLVKEELPVTGAVVYTGSGHGVTPIVEGDVWVERDVDQEKLVLAVLEGGAPLRVEDRIAFPLVTEFGVVGVVAGALHPAAEQTPEQTLAILGPLSRKLSAEAVQLDTALLFSTIRDEATAEERRRLARDLHDGVAQDLAALGYLIDDIADIAVSEAVVTQAGELREELSRVVAELRRSIFTLRNEATSGQTLGQSIAALAAHLESRSGMTVEVRLDESTARLRPDVEGELLRIAQEGMNNAVKHAKADTITVLCQVHPPRARVQVIDDGRGLQPGRDDSHGLRIMRERARRIGAVLDLHSPEDRGGTELSVELGTVERADRKRPIGAE